MSEFPPPGVAGGAAGRGQAQTTLTSAALDAVLAEFRAWFEQAAPGAPAGDGSVSETTPAAEPVDLHTLLGQFLALRHEVNLQTRAVRNQQEQSAETLSQLTQALQVLRKAQAAAEQAAAQSREETLRPVLKVLVDLYDALAPAEREVRRLSETLGPELDRLVHEAQAAVPPAGTSFWRRLFGGGRPCPAEADSAQSLKLTTDRIRQLLGSVLTGYTMSLQRLERALRQQGLEPIACAGQAFDPERMEVVEVASDTHRPPGEVIEEVRRGYVWQGRVFRYAQVRVAKP
jgi:molecular chaperone GrpE